MTAALSRRRALKGAAGAAALTFVGNVRRLHAATVAPESASLLDLSYAALAPSDLPDGDRFGVLTGISYRGGGGGVEGRALNERMVQALAASLDELLGGHFSLVAPLDGSTDIRVTTELMEFASTARARAALDEAAVGYFAGTTEVPSGNERDRFFTWTIEQSGGVTVALRAVLSRAANVVVIVTITEELAAGAQAPSAEDALAELEALRRPVALRLRAVLEPETAGLAATLPTVAEFGATASDGFTFGIFAWNQAYLQREGTPIRHIFQTDELYGQFQANFPDLEEAFFRAELPRTLEGNQLFVRIEAFRHTGEAAAETAFGNIDALTTEAMATEPGFGARKIDPPAGLATDLPAIFYLNTFDAGGSQQLGVSGWFRNGTDLVRLLIAGPPRSPAQNEDPALAAVLGELLAIGIDVYLRWNRGEGISADDFERQQQSCPELDAVLNATA
jgi:hypothetical protein